RSVLWSLSSGRPETTYDDHQGMVIKTSSSWLALLMLGIATGCVDQSMVRTGFKPRKVGALIVGYEVDLADNPTIQEQRAFGAKKVEYIRLTDRTLDSNAEMTEYFRDLAARLLKDHENELPYPVVV